MAASKKTKKATSAPKLTSISAPLSKSAMMAVISENAGITKRQVAAVFDQLTLLIESHLNKRNIGKFILPGILKIEVKRKPATKARKGVNPFTGAEMTFKAKPARNVVKIRPLKRVKDMVA